VQNGGARYICASAAKSPKFHSDNTMHTFSFRTLMGTLACSAMLLSSQASFGQYIPGSEESIASVSALDPAVTLNVDEATRSVSTPVPNAARMRATVWDGDKDPNNSLILRSMLGWQFQVSPTATPLNGVPIVLGVGRPISDIREPDVAIGQTANSLFGFTVFVVYSAIGADNVRHVYYEVFACNGTATTTSMVPGGGVYAYGRLDNDAIGGVTQRPRVDAARYGNAATGTSQSIVATYERAETGGTSIWMRHFTAPLNPITGALSPLPSLFTAEYVVAAATTSSSFSYPDVAALTSLTGSSKSRAYISFIETIKNPSTNLVTSNRIVVRARSPLTGAIPAGEQNPPPPPPAPQPPLTGEYIVETVGANVAISPPRIALPGNDNETATPNFFPAHWGLVYSLSGGEIRLARRSGSYTAATFVPPITVNAPPLLVSSAGTLTSRSNDKPVLTIGQNGVCYVAWIYDDAGYNEVLGASQGKKVALARRTGLTGACETPVFVTYNYDLLSSSPNASSALVNTTLLAAAGRFNYGSSFASNRLITMVGTNASNAWFLKSVVSLIACGNLNRPSATITSQSAEKVQILPNPGGYETRLEISLSEKESLESIEMVSLTTGQSIKSQLPAQLREGGISLADLVSKRPLAAGLYVVRVQTSKGVYTKNFQYLP
jgi:hypothetical protein